jgi:mono/diheme cytochrome c family protein
MVDPVLCRRGLGQKGLQRSAWLGSRAMRSTGFTGGRRLARVLLAATVAALMLALAACGGSSSPSSGSSGSSSSSKSTASKSTASKTTASKSTASKSTASKTTASKSTASSGKQIFTSAGCAGCHTLAAAHATGPIGPNLDQVKPSEATVVEHVTNGGGGMPSFSGSLSKAQITAVAKFVASAAR